MLVALFGLVLIGVVIAGAFFLYVLVDLIRADEFIIDRERTRHIRTLQLEHMSGLHQWVRDENCQHCGPVAPAWRSR